MNRAADMLVPNAGLRGPDPAPVEIATLHDRVTAEGAKAINLGDFGLGVGKAAHLVVCDQPDTIAPACRMAGLDYAVTFIQSWLFS